MIVRRRPRLPTSRSVLVLLPSGATLLNLFFGIFAIIQASRSEFSTAALFVVLGGVADTLDGRIARATGTGSRFGEELDSLVDAITFGLAPAMIMYFSVLNREGWDWIWVFVYTAAAVTRLARFNVEQAGTAKTHFHGLPSPAAGMTLATYIWFGQTSMYNDTIRLFGDDRVLADLPWHTMMRFLMVGLAALMVSNVPYPTIPQVGIRSMRQIVGTVIVLGTLLGVVFVPRQFFFPALIAYIVYGLLAGFVMRVLDRPATPTIFLEEEPDEDEGEIEVASEPLMRSTDVLPPERPRSRDRERDRERDRDREERRERKERKERRPDRADRDRDRGERLREPRPPREAVVEGAGEAETPEAAARRKRRRRRGRDRGDRPSRERGERGERPPGDAPSESSSPPPAAPPPQEPNE